MVGSTGGAGARSLADWPGFLPPPTSNRACDIPAHGSPTFLTGGHSVSRSPRPVGSWRDAVKMLIIMSNPSRAMQMVDTLEQVFATGEPDPETVGPLLAQLDMEILEPIAP